MLAKIMGKAPKMSNVELPLLAVVPEAVQNPKSEIRRKHQGVKQPCFPKNAFVLAVLVNRSIRTSDFGFLSDFGFRHSGLSGAYTLIVTCDCRVEPQ